MHHAPPWSGQHTGCALLTVCSRRVVLRVATAPAATAQHSAAISRRATTTYIEGRSLGSCCQQRCMMLRTAGGTCAAIGGRQPLASWLVLRQGCSSQNTCEAGRSADWSTDGQVIKGRHHHRTSSTAVARPASRRGGAAPQAGDMHPCCGHAHSLRHPAPPTFLIPFNHHPSPYLAVEHLPDQQAKGVHIGSRAGRRRVAQHLRHGGEE